MALSYVVNGGTILLAGVLLAFPLVLTLKHRLKKSPMTAACWNALRSFSLCIIFLVAVLACFKNAYNPFIYFNF